MITFNEMNGMGTGDVLSLADEKTIAQAIKDGVGFESAKNGLDLVVKRIQRMDSQDGTSNLLFVEFEDSNLVLHAFHCEDEMDLSVFKKVDWFDPNDRKAVVEREDTFLFNEPKDTSDFTFHSLEFADTIKLEELEQPYSKMLETYAVDDEEIPVIVVSYSSENDETPQLLVTEAGWMDQDGEETENGGLLVVYEGRNVETSSVSVM